MGLMAISRIAHAEPLHHVARILDADAGSVIRRHHHRVHLVRAQRIGRDRQRQRRIDATRQPQVHTLETILGRL